MARFDVYENTNPATRREIPFLLDVQADLLDGLASRVVAPLVRAEAMGKPAQRLNPTFRIDHIEVVMSTAELAGVPKMVLGNKVGSLARHQDEIVAALDFLFTGY
ncbi:MAG: CcdB family protein [Thermodesulfobacteriota bacterium]